MCKKIVVGTRGSALALRQTELVVEQIRTKHPETEFEIRVIKTRGDADVVSLLKDESYKGFFVKEIELALLSGEIDFAVHSYKDMSVVLTEGLVTAAVPERESVNDVFVSFGGEDFYHLSPGAVVGTNSLRRALQLRMLRDDIIIKEIRGNINSRLDKLRSGLYDGLVLAHAGLRRLGIDDSIRNIFSIDEIVPSAAQGALSVQTRAGDARIIGMVSSIAHRESVMRTEAEREFAGIFNAGCSTPVGACAVIDGAEFVMTGINFYGERGVKKSVRVPLQDYKKAPVLLAGLIRGEM